jgi:hypothetical protein
MMSVDINTETGAVDGRDGLLDQVAHDISAAYDKIPGHKNLDFNKRHASGFGILKIYDDDRLNDLIDPESSYSVVNMSVNPSVDGLPCSIDLILQERSTIAVLVEHLGEWPSPAVIHKYVAAVLIDPDDLADRMESLYSSASDLAGMAREDDLDESALQEYR